MYIPKYKCTYLTITKNSRSASYISKLQTAMVIFVLLAIHFSVVYVIICQVFKSLNQIYQGYLFICQIKMHSYYKLYFYIHITIIYK